jgi:Flp pilus assembly protein TadG
MKAPRDRLRAWARRLLADRKGVTAVEFAIVAPVLVIVCVGIIDMGLAIYTDMQVKNAAQTGAQYAVANGYHPDDIAAQAKAGSTLGSLSMSPAPAQFCGCPGATGVSSTSCSAVCADGSSPGTFVTVSAQASYSTLVPYPGLPSSFQFNESSTVRLQ